MSIISKIFSNISGIVGASLVLIYVISAIAAPLAAPYNPYEMDHINSLRSPDSSYWAGTDQFGRDIFSRIIYGARISLFLAVTSMLLSAIFGGVLGAVLGYVGGKADLIVMRFVDILMSFPSLILALTLVAFMGASLRNIIIAIAIPFTPVFVRMGRSAAIPIKEEEYCKASKASGASIPWIIYHHVLPNVFPLLLTQTTLSFSKAIIFESSLSFLGLGVQPPLASWGQMLGAGRQFMTLAPWIAIAPGLAISIVVIGLNLLGDTLRDVADPHLQNTR